MTTYVLIGVGGTGAKVVEATLQMMLAGLGPGKVLVGLVDQDQANGNVARTLSLFNDMQRLRQDFGPASPDRLVWADAEAGEGMQLGRVEIESLFEDGPHWRPSSDDETTLAEILDRATLAAGSSERDLFDALFEPGPLEQDLDLAQGYRGRAHVGAAALIAHLAKPNPMSDAIDALSKRGTVASDVRIFLVGSAFGGTGAAGFPILARSIHKVRAAKSASVQAQTRIGGALMLPYFAFVDSGEPNVVQTGDLIPQARLALEYYQQLFRTEHVFDQLYVAGWDQMSAMQYHAPGDNGQTNPPMPAELLGALAALDFFERDLPETAGSDGFSLAARRDVSRLGWADLPVTEARRPVVVDRLGRLTRTALYWNYVLEPALEGREEKRFRSHPWMQKLTADVVWGDPGAKARRERLSALFQRHLLWVGAMQMFAGETPRRTAFNLWNTDSVNARVAPREPTNPLDIKDVDSIGGSAAIAAAFESVIIPPDVQHRVRDADDFLSELANWRPKKTGKSDAGFGVLLAAAHHAARIQ